MLELEGLGESKNHRSFVDSNNIFEAIPNRVSPRCKEGYDIRNSRIISNLPQRKHASRIGFSSVEVQEFDAHL